MREIKSQIARIGLISPWASRLGGGVFEAVVSHCEMVRDIGFEPVVVALEDQHSAADRARFGDVQVITVPVVGPPMIGYAPAMVMALLDAKLDLLHLHGIWMYPSAAASAWAAKTGRPYVISPHGMLDPWIVGRGKLKKAVAKAAYEERNWKRASVFHALTQSEAKDVRDTAGRSEAVIIPNAIAAAAPHGLTDAGSRSRDVVYLGRIHPKKNIDGLIAGWQLARDVLAPAGARLRIAGWGDADHVEALKAQIAADGQGDITFLGPVYGEEKASLIGSASYMALPSHSEGLPVVILEAWALGTPTIMSRHCHLPEGYACNAAIDSGTDAESIAASLRQAFAQSPQEWAEMSTASRALIDERFSPQVVSRQWHGTYQRLLQESRA